MHRLAARQGLLPETENTSCPPLRRIETGSTFRSVKLPVRGVLGPGRFASRLLVAEECPGCRLGRARHGTPVASSARSPRR
jgi:hypothetical protein